MFFCTIYTNQNHKLLVRVKKPIIAWDKFQGLALRGGFKIFQKEKAEENEALIFIYFGIKKLVLILIINSRICL